MHIIASIGTRWLLRWEKEVDLATRFLYLGLTTGLCAYFSGNDSTFQLKTLRSSEPNVG